MSAGSSGKPWMVFVDGENLTIRAEQWAEKVGIKFEAGNHYSPGTFVWIPSLQPRVLWGTHAEWATERFAIRAYYYTSVQGDDDKIASTKETLRHLDFHPAVFKKISSKSKGVDISLTRDMLSHAYRGDYDVAVLFAGDRDYLPLVEAVQQLGKRVHLAFFGKREDGLSPDLRVVCDAFIELDGHFMKGWKMAR